MSNIHNILCFWTSSNLSGRLALGTGTLSIKPCICICHWLAIVCKLLLIKLLASILAILLIYFTCSFVLQDMHWYIDKNLEKISPVGRIDEIYSFETKNVQSVGFHVLHVIHVCIQYYSPHPTIKLYYLHHTQLLNRTTGLV